MEFTRRFTVRFGDIDYVGIFYYPRLFHYLHQAKEDFWRERLGGHYQVEWASSDGGNHAGNWVVGSRIVRPEVRLRRTPATRKRPPLARLLRQ